MVDIQVGCGCRIVADAAHAGTGRTFPILAEHTSISSSLVSGSLKPPRAKNLMPLSGMGLWDAEITAPISTFSTEVRYATPGVGIMPASITSNPPADMPADSAAARKSPETRVSRPTSARRRPSNSLCLHHRQARAPQHRPNPTQAVRSKPYSPILEHRLFRTYVA
mgnify:CR=1 FL=1